MTAETPNTASTDRERLLAHRCPNDHLTYPGHTVCPTCGREQTETVDLTDRTATVVTWTESIATPSGVRAPNTMAIVEFTAEGNTVSVLGQMTDDVAIGDTVQPVFIEELRDPDVSLRAKESQSWAGYRFEPVR
ncbi:nucleic acid-binding protein [Salinibaculum salinum]|uniref:Zn-ribbon domain-containing OB-fold protein n=1 Tax=Salinibaculum salinum TaxID=3131996 RepID=UPI0030ED6217